MEHVFHTVLPEWVYLQVHLHQSLQDQLARLAAIRTFRTKAIVELVPVDNACLLEIGGDSEEPSAYLFDIGDWVTPQIGVYEGDLGCVVGRYTWGYDVMVIPRFPKGSTTPHRDITMPVGNYEELLPLSLEAMAGEKDPIQDGFQVVELSDKTLVHAENLDWNDLEKFMWPPLVEWPDNAMPIQDIVDNLLWKCPMPKHWYFCEGDVILANSMTLGTVKRIQRTAMEIEIEGVGRHWYAWLEVIKMFHLGDYVEVFAGEHKGRSGFMQGIHDPVLVDILQGAASKGVGQIEVHHNSVAAVTPLQNTHTLVDSPEEISWRMRTGKVPWMGLHVLVLPAVERPKKRPLDLMAATLHASTDHANKHKGKIGTVLDVNIDQTLDSGLRVTGLPLHFYQPLCHDQESFLPSLQYRRAWKEELNVLHGQAFAATIGQRLQRISPPPPRPAMPLHERPSEDHGTGNVWDSTAPEPPDPSTIHWSRDPRLAQHQLRVNIPGKSQPQKVLLELSGARCNIKIIFRTTLTEVLNVAGVTPVEPTVHDFHRWVIIKGHHVGKYVQGIRYMQGTKPILWTVHQITLVQDEHDLLVGEAFDIPNCDLCQAADTQKTLDTNFQWAQSIREEPIKPKKQRKA
ncbi:hypothetical protein IW262DRAFT_1465253 [Armillaria fumosa]|nr:hypothetical protein IW262DRAFT_1465253 [Armillaria fumosa]